MALLRVLTLGALPAVELVGVVYGTGHDEALEPHPADVADGAREEDVRLSSFSKGCGIPNNVLRVFSGFLHIEGTLGVS